MANDDKHNLATKEDIRLLREDMKFVMEQMGTYYSRTEGQIADLKDEMVEWKDAVVLQFQVIAEDLRHDLIGIHKDKIEDHEQRLIRLESKAA
jgi:hypothetical protein